MLRARCQAVAATWQSAAFLPSSSAQLRGTGTASAADRVAAKLTKSRLLERHASLASEAKHLRGSLAAMDATFAAADKRGQRAVAVAGAATFAFLAAQFGVLFNWVFFVFDWNLVEPVTYFLGYTCTWFGIVFYARTGIEWSYDSTRDYIREWRRSAVLKRQGFDVGAYEATRAQLSKTEAELAALRIRD